MASDLGNIDTGSSSYGVSSTGSEPRYEVVWPSSPRGVQAAALAPRLDTLDGKRIAFLWDFLFRGDELFPVLEKRLVERFEGVEIVGYDEFGNTHGSDESEMIAGLGDALKSRHIDAVVSAVGC